MTRLFPRPLAALLGALLLLGAAQQQAVAQQSEAARPPAQAAASMAPVPPPLRGTWFTGGCAAPEAMLHVTARSVARLPASGPARLIRFGESRTLDGWSMGTGRGAEAPRVLLRGDAARLETALPDSKLRDDRLPGDTPVRVWHRCPAPPPAFAALHGEGIAFLGTLEVLEAACGAPDGSAAGCIAALVSEGDVSGDGLLSVVAVSRIERGMTWVMAAAEEAGPEGVVAASAGGMLGGVATARFAMESLDYDGDGKLSARELAQDRAAFPRGSGSEAGRPLRLEGVQEGIALMRGLMEGVLLGP